MSNIWLYNVLSNSFFYIGFSAFMFCLSYDSYYISCHPSRGIGAKGCPFSPTAGILQLVDRGANWPEDQQNDIKYR